jgi:hypothetical protein
MNSWQNSVAENNNSTYIDDISEKLSKMNIIESDANELYDTDDKILNEYDSYIGTYLYNIFYSKNKVDPELYIQKYTMKYNELKSIYCPKHWAPSIFSHKIRIPKTYNICPVTQATQDFWKMYQELEINKKLD